MPGELPTRGESSAQTPPSWGCLPLGETKAAGGGLDVGSDGGRMSGDVKSFNGERHKTQQLNHPHCISILPIILCLKIHSNIQSTFDIVYFSHYKHFPWDTRARNTDTGGRACLGAQPDGPWASLTARPSPPDPPQAHHHLGAWVHLDPRPTPARELMSPLGSFSSPEKGFSISHEPRERPEQKVRP